MQVRRNAHLACAASLNGVICRYDLIVLIQKLDIAIQNIRMKGNLSVRN